MRMRRREIDQAPAPEIDKTEEQWREELAPSNSGC